MEKIYKAIDLNIVSSEEDIAPLANVASSNGITFNKVSPTTISSTTRLFSLGFTIPTGSSFYAIKIRSNNGIGWIEQIASSNTGNSYTATFEIKANYSTQRECEIVVYADNQSLYSIFVLRQERGTYPFALVTDELTVDYNEYSSYSIPISLSYGFNPALLTITENVDWLSYTNIDMIREDFIFDIERNDTTSTRTGIFTLTYDNSYSATLTVTQTTNKQYFALSKETVTVNADGSHYDEQRVIYSMADGVRITSMSRGVADWFAYTVDDVNKTIIITANKPNLTDNQRTGELTINVTSDYPDFKDKVYKIKVIQDTFGTIGFIPTVISFDADGKAIRTNYSVFDIKSYSISGYEWEPETEFLPDWYSLSWDDKKLTATVERIEPNNTTVERKFTEIMIADIVYDKETGDSFRKSFPITIVQQPALPYVECGIWKDTFYTLNKSDHSKYQYYRLINKDNNIGEIYRGRIFFINDTINLKINDIARNQMDYLKNPLQTEYTDNNGYVNLQLQVSQTGGIWEGIEDYHFYNNYSYNESYNDVFPLISKPIFNTLDKRQYFILSFQDYVSTMDRSSTILITSNYGDVSTNGRYTAKNSQNTIAYKVEGYDDIYLSFNHDDEREEHFTVKETCKPYCIYYIDRNGGWCWLNCANGERESNQITTYNYNQNVNNSFSDTFENTVYLKEYKEQWKLNTPLLNDEQFKMMKDVFLSPVVYLHLLEEDKVIAVNIVDKTWNQQTYKGNKFKPFFCTFTVENSQNKIIA